MYIYDTYYMYVHIISICFVSLGWQRSSRGQVAEEKEMLKPNEFHEKYVLPGIPVVFRKVLENVPAMKSWSKDEYLRNKQVF